MCVRGIDLVSVSTISQLDLGTVLTVWYFFVFHFIKKVQTNMKSFFIKFSIHIFTILFSKARIQQYASVIPNCYVTMVSIEDCLQHNSLIPKAILMFSLPVSHF